MGGSLLFLFILCPVLLMSIILIYSCPFGSVLFLFIFSCLSYTFLVCLFLSTIIFEKYMEYFCYCSFVIILIFFIPYFYWVYIILMSVSVFQISVNLLTFYVLWWWCFFVLFLKIFYILEYKCCYLIHNCQFEFTV